MFSAVYPPCGVPVYPTTALFPVTTYIGALAVDASTENLYAFNGTTWILIGGPGGGAGANVHLSNLASVAVNTDLLPGSPDSISLGGAGESWNNLYINSIYASPTGAPGRMFDDSGVESLDWRLRRGFDNSGHGSLFWNTRFALDSSTVTSIDWGSRLLVDNGGSNAADYQNRLLVYNDGATTSVDWQNSFLYDTSSKESLGWQARQLLATDGTTVNLDWSSPGTIELTSAALNMNGHQINNLAAPTLPNDGATKVYVDNFINATTWKIAALVATTANITLSGEQMIDGVTTSASRVLVKNQSTPAQNGLYTSGSGAWTRTADMNTWAMVPAAAVFIQSGTINSDLGWVCTAAPGGTLGTTAINFVQFSSAGAYLADGTTLQLVSGVFSVKAGGIGTTQLANSGVTYAKLQNEATTTLLGNPTGSPAAPSEITLGATLTFSGSALRTAAMTGDVTTSANSFATSLVATSNGTLTTLSALTTASSLASIGTVTTGTWHGTAVDIAHGGTNATSASAAFNNLSPMTTGGDLIYGGASGAGTRLANGSSGQVLTSAGGTSAPTWSNVPTASYAQAYFSNSSTWSTTSTSYADPTNSGGNTLTVRQSAGITLTAAASNVCGVTFTPPSTSAVYLVSATFNIWNTTDGDASFVRLTDGTTVIAGSFGVGNSEATTHDVGCPMIVHGIYAPGSSSAVTVKLQLGVAAGTANISGAPLGSGGTLNNTYVEWTVLRIV